MQNANKYYNDLQGLLKLKADTKVIKMPSWKAWLMRLSGLMKRGKNQLRF
jgi:hypothetical protein